MDAHQRQRTLSPLRRIAACGAVIVLGFVIWEAVRHGQVASSRQALLGMTVLAGGIIGVLLAVAGRLGARREGTESASLYAADLLGGGIAAAVVSMLLIPLSGLDRTAIVLAVSGVAAAMMVKR